MPTPQVRAALGQYGYTEGDPDEFGAAVDYFKAGGVITKNYACMVSATVGGVIACATNAALHRFVGFAPEAAVTNDVVTIVSSGKAKAVAEAAITQFDKITISTTTAGKVITLTAATAVTTYGNMGKCLGVALEAASADGDVIDILVKHF